MCLAVISIKSQSKNPVILLSNRDEFHKRPSDSMSLRGGVYSGIDKVSGGTWFGVSEKGRFCVLTNARISGIPKNMNAPSRGELVKIFVESDLTAEEFTKKINSSEPKYERYNMIFGYLNSNNQNIFYLSDNAKIPLRLNDGIYGLANDRLESGWFKIVESKKCLSNIIESDSIEHSKLHSILTDSRTAPDDKLPDTGISKEKEKMWSSIFVKDKVNCYGTRYSTTMVYSRPDHVSLQERSYDSSSKLSGITEFNFHLKNSVNSKL